MAKLKTFYINDQNPDINQTDIPRMGVPESRYRLSLEDRTNFTDSIYAIANITKLSDQYVMQDFFQGEFRIDPVPDNVVAVTKMNPSFSLSLASSVFRQTISSPPQNVNRKWYWTSNGTRLFGGPIFYEGETGFANLRLEFPEDSGVKNYGTDRFDTFHQLTFPNTYFGWLSIVPRVGYRGTYYGKTWDLGSTIFVPPSNPLVPELHPAATDNSQSHQVRLGTRFEASSIRARKLRFKISRKWEDVQSRAFGLDGLMHVIQPFTDFSYVKEDGPKPTLRFAIRSI